MGSGGSGSTFLRITLLVLLGFLALNACAGGYYGVAGPVAIPRAWLEGSPFTTYFVPSIVLVVAVGGSGLVAVIALAGGARSGPLLASVAGYILVTWIVFQFAIIGWVSPLQPAVLALGALVIGMASILRRANRRASVFDRANRSLTTSL